MVKLLGIFLVVFSFSNLLYSKDNQSGFVVALEGDVSVYRPSFSKGKADIPADSINAKWQGKIYKSFKAKLYSKIYQGDVIVTGNTAKVKFVMSGSNTLVVGPLTHFVVELTKDLGKGNSQSVFKLMYGKIRSVVKSKIVGEGKYEMTTPSSVIGVRGTDFYAVYSPQKGTTTVSTLEGVVAVSNLTGKIKKEVLVESGYSTTVINLASVDVAQLKKGQKTDNINKLIVPAVPSKVRSMDLNQIKDISTISTQLSNIEVDIKNMQEAKSQEAKIIDVIKTEKQSVDLTNDPFNMSLDKLIDRVTKEEKLRQKDSGSLEKVDKWMKNY